MSYLVTVTFDLKNGDSSSYKKVDEALSSIGLSKTIKGSNGIDNELPANTYAGEFEGESQSKVRTDICDQVQNTFKNFRIKATAFVSVGGSWAWGIRNT